MLERSLAAFGENRIMWSGDWNRAGMNAGDHASAISLLDELSFLDASSKGKIRRSNAIRIFGIGVI